MRGWIGKKDQGLALVRVRTSVDPSEVVSKSTRIVAGEPAKGLASMAEITVPGRGDGRVEGWRGGGRVKEVEGV